MTPFCFEQQWLRVVSDMTTFFAPEFCAVVTECAVRHGRNFLYAVLFYAAGAKCIAFHGRSFLRGSVFVARLLYTIRNEHVLRAGFLSQQ